MGSNKHENNGPRRVLGNSWPIWLSYVLVGLIVVALAGGLWSIVAPESLARLHGQLLNQPLSIDSLTITVDRQTVELPPNGTMEIHPAQRFAIAGLKTNRWHNYDLRFHGRDFDVAAITGGALAAPRELLTGEAFERPRELRIEVLDKGQVAAVFTILSRFTVMDFAARADAAGSPAAKAANYQKALDLDPGSEVIRDKLIAALIEAGQKSRAAELLEEELARSGQDEKLLTRLLGFYQDLNTVPKQVETLGRLIELAQSQGRPTTGFRIQLARLYKESGWPAQAAEIYESLAAGDVPAAEASAYLGELVVLYHDSRDSEREIATLKRLTEITPPDQASALWMKIAELYKKSGDEAGSLAAWRALADSLPEGDSKVNALKMVGHLLYLSQKYDEAREAYQQALKMAPQDSNILLNLARLSAAIDDRAAYRNYLTQTVDLEGDRLDLRRELAEALVLDKQNAKAKEQYQAILAKKPDDREIRLALIDLMEKTGDKKGLTAQYALLAEQHPGDQAVALYNLGVHHFGGKEYSQAIEAFQKVVALNPKDLEAREYLVAAYQRKGPGKANKEKMLAEALAIYKMAPSKTVYRTLLLNTYENDKDWKNFAQVAREVTKLEPESDFGWAELARAQNTLNQKEAAADSLWKVAEKTKVKKVEAWLSAGRAFSSLKNNDRARQAYQEVLKLDPKNQAADRAIKAIAAP